MSVFLSLSKGTFLLWANMTKFGIDTFLNRSKIQPNMFSPFALPRSRRPQPISCEKVGSFSSG